jgi:hypothetical protein
MMPRPTRLLRLLPYLAAASLLGCGGNQGGNNLTFLDVTPATATVAPSGTVDMIAFLPAATSDYTWTIQEGAAGGTLTLGSSEGTTFHDRATYTAPAAPGVYHVHVTGHNAAGEYHSGSTVTVAAN